MVYFALDDPVTSGSPYEVLENFKHIIDLVFLIDHICISNDNFTGVLHASRQMRSQGPWKKDWTMQPQT